MATVSSNINPNPLVIPQTNVDPNPGQTALNRGIDRNNWQHKLVNVSKGIGGGTSSKSKMKKSKKMRMSKRMSRMSSRRRFSRKFRKSLRLSSRKSVLGRRRNKHKNKKLSRGGAGTITIPSFSQTTPNGTAIINQLASNHAQTVKYSVFDGDVKPPGAPST